MMQNCHEKADIKTLVGKRNPFAIVDNHRAFSDPWLHDVQNQMFMATVGQGLMIKTPAAADVENPAFFRKIVFKDSNKTLGPAFKIQSGVVFDDEILDFLLNFPDFGEQSGSHGGVLKADLEGG